MELGEFKRLLKTHLFRIAEMAAHSEGIYSALHCI